MGTRLPCGSLGSARGPPAEAAQRAAWHGVRAGSLCRPHHGPSGDWGPGRQGVSTWVSGSVKACNRLMKKIPLLFSVSQRSTEVGRATGTATERQSWSATPGRAPPPPRSPASLQEGATHTACVTGPGGAGQDGTGQTLSLPRGLRGPPGGFTSGSDAATAAGVRLD